MNQRWLLYFALAGTIVVLAELVVWGAALSYGEMQSAVVRSVAWDRPGRRIGVEEAEAEGRDAASASFISLFYPYQVDDQLRVLWISDTPYCWPADGTQYLLSSSLLFTLPLALTCWLLLYWQRWRAKLR